MLKVGLFHSYTRDNTRQASVYFAFFSIGIFRDSYIFCVKKLKKESSRNLHYIIYRHVNCFGSFIYFFYFYYTFFFLVNTFRLCVIKLTVTVNIYDRIPNKANFKNPTYAKPIRNFFNTHVLNLLIL